MSPDGASANDEGDHRAVDPVTMPIAIIGISCRFPGDATSPEKLWEMVAEKRSAWSEIPSNRFNQESFYHPVGGHLSTVSATTSNFDP